VAKKRDNKPEKPEEDPATRLKTRVEGHDGGGASETGEQWPEIPGFRLIRELGQGGMGLVFLAEQSEPVQRKVALKLIRRKMHNPYNVARFEVERQALAQMQHPAIAQVFDAGTTPGDFPYFVMEYVPGETLEEYCTSRALNLRQRLELFVRICRGVQHAHQKGIIHRDLKPGNILVSTVDSQPVPKIIDFGIATAAGVPMERSVSPESSAGTPRYMSPEQLSGEGGIDTRSDVYSLGVILYELLVDQPPFERTIFRESDPARIHRKISKKAISRPSTRLQETGEVVTAIARRRNMRLTKLRRGLRGDLDAIALMALSIDREHRYASVADLAADLCRYLDNKPVRAMPLTPGYKMRKFVGRNSLALGSASAVVLALVAGLTAATLGMFEAQRQAQVAEERKQELELVVGFQQSMLEELDPRAMGEGLVDGLRRQFARAMEAEADQADYQAGLSAFETAVGRTNPTDLARELIDEFMLSRALSSIERDFADQPLLKADLYKSVLEVYSSVGLDAQALDLAERIVALREMHQDRLDPDLLKARRNLGWSLFSAGRLEDARDHLVGILETIDDERLFFRHPDYARLNIDVLDDLAIVKVELGDREEALELARAANDLAEMAGPLDPDHQIQLVSSIGYVHARSGNLEQALEKFKLALEQARAIHEPEHNRVTRAMLNVESALGGLGRFDEAIEISEQLLPILFEVHGRSHPHTLRAMNNKANHLNRLGRLDEAIPLLEEVVERRSQGAGPTHPLTLRARLNLGSALLANQQPDRALELLEPVARQREALLGPNHLDTLTALELLANAKLDTGSAEAALPMIQSVHENRRELLGDDHAHVMHTTLLVARVHRELGNSGEEMALLQDYVHHRREGERLADQTGLESAIRLHMLLIDAGREQEAGELAEAIEQGLAETSEDHANLRETFSRQLGQQ